jgi:polysaccharide pyruvyl transferase WcaK-like protein
MLVGNYGVGNMGDEALQKYFLHTFLDVEWTVVSYDVPRLPFGIRSLFTPWWKTVLVLWKTDGVVFGGGSLFTDVESLEGPFLWGWHAGLAWFFGKPVYLAFQGIGPFRTRISTYITRWTVQRARFISVRDDASFERIRQWRGDVVKSFDPVFLALAKSRDVSTVRDSVGRRHIVIIPRANSHHTFVNRAKDIYARGTFDAVSICSLEPGNPREKAVCETLLSIFPDSILHTIHAIDQLIDIVSSASFVLSQRYHGALIAFALGVPFDVIAQYDNDKLSSLLALNREDALRLVNAGESALRRTLYEY